MTIGRTLLEQSVQYDHDNTETSYENGEYGWWLCRCERFIWQSMLSSTNEHYWGRMAFGPSAAAWIYVDLLVNLARFIDNQAWIITSEDSKFELLALVYKMLEGFGPNQTRHPQHWQLINRLRNACSDIETRRQYGEWGIHGIQILSGMKVTGNIWQDQNLTVPAFRIPYQVPQRNALGLLTEITRSAGTSVVTLSEFDADFINSGPFKLVITGQIDEHLTLDAAKGHILIFWDRQVCPGRSASVMKNNRIAK